MISAVLHARSAGLTRRRSGMRRRRTIRSAISCASTTPRRVSARSKSSGQLSRACASPWRRSVSLRATTVVQPDSSRYSHHSRLQTSLLGHHAVIPWRIEHQLHVRARHGGNDLHLIAHILNQNLPHAAAGSRERHLDVDRAGIVDILGDIAFVYQAEIDDIDRDLRVVAGLELLPYHVLDVLFGGARRDFRRFGRRLADGIAVLAGDAEQVAVDVDREAAAQGLRDVAHRSELEVHLDAGRYGDSL